MTNSTSTRTARSSRTTVRRGLAGLVAAATIAFGGTTMLSASEAQAAGVQATNYSNTYAVQSDQVSVKTGTVRKAA